MSDGASDSHRFGGPGGPGGIIPTGVPGLDHVLYGGFRREGFILVQGDPGSGKTTLALQFVIESRRRNEPVLYITLTESTKSLENTARSHGWSLEGLEIVDLTRAELGQLGDFEASIFHPSEVELGETTRKILAEVERVRPCHVIFDSLSEMRLLAGDPLRYRRQMLALRNYFEDRRITALLLDDRTNPFGQIQPESLVDANIIMEKDMPGYGGARRRLHVTKVRGADFRDGYHDYEITTGGLSVHPRLVAAEHRGKVVREQFQSGVANLDSLLGGGLAAGTTTLMLGPSGAGKSTTAMQYVSHALDEGRKAVVYVFDEVLETFFERSEKLCRSGIRRYAQSGALLVRQVDPAELTPGAFAHEVRRAVEQGAEVVVIDSLNGYLNAMPEERFLTTHLHELFSYLNQRGVATIMVVVQHGMLLATSEVDVSYLADTVLLFRYFESRGEILQALGVFKKRTGAHERSLRQLKISAEGLSVGEPLCEFSGIMTGVPQYEAHRPGEVGSGEAHERS